MLFSNPDYPVFLIAVFFLYAVSRVRDARGFWSRAALLVLLGDIVFVLVAKDLDAVWDPIGGILLRQVASYGSEPVTWTHLWRWPIGLVAILWAISIGRRAGPYLASKRGQSAVAIGVVVSLALVGSAVLVAILRGSLEELTQTIVSFAHLAVLFVLGVAIGLGRDKRHRALGRVIVLFIASSLFYQAWAAAMPGPYRYLLGLLLGTIILDYYLALWIERTVDPARRKALVLVSLVSNLGILFFFKYADFVTHDVLHLPVGRLDLILPAGISFHTFQSLSYTIDVYRKQLKATRSPIEFATFVLFFPQLVAGPIVRAQDLLPQLHDLPHLELERATRGLFRIVVGLFKKIALADTLALFIVDRVFEAPTTFSSLEVLCGVYAYALQIYLDFSAYSDIAIGSADILGFNLPENFRTPYRSANLQEFWRRWHISLSTWLRDYLYIALGGNRGAAWRTYFNLIATMILGGLWHGASWAFVVWGALHGFGLAVTRFFQRSIDKASMIAGCALVFAIGYAVHRTIIPSSTGTWTQLVFVWLYATPLWAVLTAWLGREEKIKEVIRWSPTADALRVGMCATGLSFISALKYGSSSSWLPWIAITWALALAADILDRGTDNMLRRLVATLRRTLSVILVFHYVCLAWIFFRAGSFDTALAVLRQLAAFEFDHANLVPTLTTALAVGFACHFFADRSFHWLRDQFCQLPAIGQGALLAACALILRELAHTQVVPFIYFQF